MTIRFYFLLATLLTLFPSFAYGVDIAVEIKERNVIARSGTNANEVATSGIPIPIAQQAVTSWACFEATGTTQVPCSYTILSGRVKGLLVSYQVASLSLNTATSIIVRDTTQTASLGSANDVGVTEDANTIVVDTGTGGIQATISKTSFNFVHEVKLDGDSNGSFESTIVGAPTNPLRVNGTRTSSAMANYDFVPSSFTWDYQTPHRALLRIDGSITDGTELLKSTVLLEFRARSTAIKIEWILRNNVQLNQTKVKISSAIIKFGSGTDTLTQAIWGRLEYANVDTDGLAFQAVPTLAICQTPASNGGFIIQDLSNYTTTLVADFATGLTTQNRTDRTKAWKEPLQLRAPASLYSDTKYLSSGQFGTEADEEAAYGKLHWAWTSGNKITEAAKLDYEIDWVDADTHDVSEGDDLEIHTLQWIRTGAGGEWSRAQAWARYFKHEFPFRSVGFDFAWDTSGEGPSPVTRSAVSLGGNETSSSGHSCSSAIMADNEQLTRITGRMDLRTFTDDHAWGWGLVDWYFLTGDIEAKNAAIDLAEVSERLMLWRTPGSFYPANAGGRKEARQSLRVQRVHDATLATRWSDLDDHIFDLFMQSPTCNFTSDSTDGCWDGRGFYAAGSSTTNNPAVLNPQGGYLPYQNDVRLTENFMHADLQRAHTLYWERKTSTPVRDRAIAMAAWAKEYGLSQTYNHAGSVLAMDWNGSAYEALPRGKAFHRNANLCTIDCQIQPWRFYDSLYDIVPTDVLARGYRLTGDVSYLARAAVHLDMGTRVGARNGTASPTQFCSSGTETCYIKRVTGEHTVARFLGNNGYKSGDIYLDKNAGDIPYTAQITYDLARLTTSWGQAGGSQNVHFQGSSLNPAVVGDSTNIYGAWIYHTKPDDYTAPGSIAGLRVEQWNGTVWTPLGGRIGHQGSDGPSALPDVSQPSIAIHSAQPCVAWSEGTNYGWDADEETAIFVACWNGTTWDYRAASTGTHGQLNTNANTSWNPSLTVVNGLLYCAFIERQSGVNNIVVKHWTGTDWTADGSPFNAGLGSGELPIDVHITAVGTEPHVAYSTWRRQSVGAGGFNNINHGVFVKKFTAGTWTDVGSGQINAASTVTNYVSIVSFGSQPTVAYNEKTATGQYKLFVKQWNGSTWAALGGDLRLDTVLGEIGSPSLAVANSILWVGFTEYALHRPGQVYVRSWSGSAWNAAEGSLNYDMANGGASRVALAARGNNLFALHDEHLESTKTRQVYGHERNSTQTVVADTYTKYGSNGGAVSPVDNTWTSMSAGGLGGLSSGTGCVWDEGFNSLVYSPGVNKFYVMGAYHTALCGSTEFQNAVFVYDDHLNRWDIQDITEPGSWSEHLAGGGHTQGQDVMDVTNDLYVSKGNLTLSNLVTQYQHYQYDPIAKHGKRLFPALESHLDSQVNCAYSPTHKKTLCYGDRSTTGHLTWVYDHVANTWTGSTLSPQPSGRDWPGVTFDRSAGVFILYGGYNGTNALSDTWTFDPVGVAWVEKCTSCTPGTRYSPYIAYDQHNQVTLLTGGNSAVAGGSSATAYYYKHSTNTWTATTSAPSEVASPPWGSGKVLAYSDVTRRFYLYRSGGTFGALWTFKLVPSGVGPGGFSLGGGVAISGGARVQ